MKRSLNLLMTLVLIFSLFSPAVSAEQNDLPEPEDLVELEVLTASNKIVKKTH